MDVYEIRLGTISEKVAVEHCALRKIAYEFGDAYTLKGHITNKTDETIDLYIEISFFDAKDTFLSLENFENYDFNNIIAKQTVPISACIQEEIPKETSYCVLDIKKWTPPPIQAPKGKEYELKPGKIAQKITLEHYTLYLCAEDSFPNITYTAQGHITNNSDEDLDGLKIDVSYFDAKDKFLGLVKTSVLEFDKISAKGTLPFSIDVDPPHKTSYCVLNVAVDDEDENSGCLGGLLFSSQEDFPEEKLAPFELSMLEKSALKSIFKIKTKTIVWGILFGILIILAFIFLKAMGFSREVIFWVALFYIIPNIYNSICLLFGMLVVKKVVQKSLDKVDEFSNLDNT